MSIIDSRLGKDILRTYCKAIKPVTIYYPMQVFVHCEMSVCMLSDPTCTQTCEIPVEEEGGVEETNVIEAGAPGTAFGVEGGLPIAKRDVADAIPTSMSYTNTDGPIKIKANPAG